MKRVTKKMKKILGLEGNLSLIALTLFIFTFAVSSVMAQEVPLVTGDWAPYTSKDLENYGFVTEIVTAVFQEMKMTPKYSFNPWKRCEEIVKKGEAFAVFPYFETEERRPFYHFSDPIAFSNMVLFYNKKNLKQDVTFEKFEDLKAYKISGVLGYWYEKPFKDAQLNVDYVVSDEQSIKKVAIGRADLAATDELVGRALVKKLFPQQEADFDIVKKNLNQDKLRLLVSKNYPDSVALLEKFNTALKTIRANGTYQKILQKYGMKE